MLYMVSKDNHLKLWDVICEITLVAEVIFKLYGVK
jgi:hypothetical protein